MKIFVSYKEHHFVFNQNWSILSIEYKGVYLLFSWSLKVVYPQIHNQKLPVIKNKHKNRKTTLVFALENSMQNSVILWIKHVFISFNIIIKNHFYSISVHPLLQNNNQSIYYNSVEAIKYHYVGFLSRIAERDSIVLLIWWCCVEQQQALFTTPNPRCLTIIQSSIDFTNLNPNLTLLSYCCFCSQINLQAIKLGAN